MSESNIDFKVLPNALKRILEIKQKEGNENKYLRIKILGGGCSGFQYNFNLDDKIEKDDFTIAPNGDTIIVIDQTSLSFLDGCSIDYVESLGSNFFKINNPNATANCGCGNSFSV